MALRNWNKFYGTNVKAIGWTYEGPIKTEIRRNQIVQDMTAANKSWLPDGDVSKPGDMSAARISDYPQIKPERVTEWQNMVRPLVRGGQHVVKVNWVKGTEPFTTTCVADNNSLVYDSMLFSIVGGGGGTKCFDYKMWWLWERHKAVSQWTRGYIKADLTANCQGGKPVTCDEACPSSMTLGTATINCTSNIVQNCCQMRYSWAWACGLSKVKVKADNFTLEVEGSLLGSGGSGNGSCTECCIAAETAGIGTGTYGGESVKSCESEHPSLPECWELPSEYAYDSLEDALRALEEVLGLPPNSLQAQNEQPAKNGPCPDIGRHWDVIDKSNGQNRGSITSCPCCIDTEDGPVTEQRFRIHPA
jgi:hypothetical protein